MRTDPALEFPDAFAFEGVNLPGRHFTDGVSQSGRERNHFFLSREAARFDDVSGLSGLDHPADGRAFAVLDFDRDGFPDLAVVNANEPFFQLFRNELGDAGGRFLVVTLEGANRTAAARPGSSPRDGAGARVEVRVGETRLLREFRLGEGFAAQNHGRLLFGLGEADRAEAVEVVWPSGERQQLTAVEAGTRVHFRQDADPERLAWTPTPPPAAAPRDGGARLLANLPDPSGRPLRVLTTQANWCEACVAELPHVALLRDAFQDASWWGIPVEPADDRAALERWRAEHRPAYELLVDLPLAARAAASAHVKRALGREALPATIVTDAEGRVLRTRFGPPTISELRALHASLP